jgi:hypothetical protein
MKIQKQRWDGYDKYVIWAEHGSVQLEVHDSLTENTTSRLGYSPFGWTRIHARADLASSLES